MKNEIKWDDGRMTTKVQTIDAQHQVFLWMINDLLDVLSKGEGKQEIECTLQFLRMYADKHFRHEEEIMKKRNCPTQLENIAAHKLFLQQYESLLGRYRSSGASLSFVMDVQKLVGEWLVDHICKVDTKLRTCPPGEA